MQPVTELRQLPDPLSKPSISNTPSPASPQLPFVPQLAARLSRLAACYEVSCLGTWPLTRTISCLSNRQSRASHCRHQRPRPAQWMLSVQLQLQQPGKQPHAGFSIASRSQHAPASACAQPCSCQQMLWQEPACRPVAEQQSRRRRQPVEQRERRRRARQHGGTVRRQACLPLASALPL